MLVETEITLVFTDLFHVVLIFMSKTYHAFETFVVVALQSSTEKKNKD